VLVAMQDLTREDRTHGYRTHEMDSLARRPAHAVSRSRTMVESGTPERFFNPETEGACQFLQRYAGEAANGRD
jgi:ABC-type histidine transport system ATPase subunit